MSAPDVREAFLAWIRDDGYLVPSAVTDIEWDDEGLPVYYTRDDGVRHYLDGEWHAWQAATARAALAAPSGEIAVKDRFSGLTMNGAPLRPGDTFEIDGERYVFAPAAAPSAATGSVDEADRLDALRAQRAVVTRNYARDPSNENEAALYAICERVYAAERKVAAATGSGAATGPRDEAEVAWCIMRKDRTLLGNRTWTSRLGAELELACCRMEMPRTTEAEDFRVVALVPQHEEPAT